jgi:hypothetical protein
MKKYGASGHPYLIDLASLKLSPTSPLTLIDDEAN